MFVLFLILLTVLVQIWKRENWHCSLELLTMSLAYQNKYGDVICISHVRGDLWLLCLTLAAVFKISARAMLQHSTNQWGTALVRLSPP